MPVSSSTTGNGTSPRKALRTIQSNAVESLPIDHSIASGVTHEKASRRMKIVRASSSSRYENDEDDMRLMNRQGAPIA